ncbi:MAG: N-acetylmuramidase domain-containing protein, partial [Chloroflexi bacterium]|nr:N-acetylmuramidase domain-containing protein [Chloroflexota bacterium]
MIKQQSLSLIKATTRGAQRGAEINTAEPYDVHIIPVTVTEGETFWKVIHVLHLGPAENRGRSNVFIDAQDEAGVRCTDSALRVGWRWEGQRADEVAEPKLLDKPANEPASNVDIYPGQHLQIWIQGDHCPSEHVENLHAEHPEERDAEGTLGNWPGHHSFHVIFQRTRQLSEPAVTPDNGNDDHRDDHPTGEEPPPSPTAGERLTLPPDATAATIALVNTWNNFGAIIQEQATRLGLDSAIAVAVLVAESAGEAFDADGRLIIRFENHIFYEYWGRTHEEQFRQHFTFNPEQGWQGQQWRPDANSGWLPCHMDQNSEWQVFEFARHFDEQAALYSISMGAPQVMGFNYQIIGYATVQEMFQAFRADVCNQLLSLFRFMQVNKLVEAVRRGDFQHFARVYNGAGQANTYANLIWGYMTTFQSLRAAAARGITAAAMRGLDSEGAPSHSPMPPSPIPGKPLSEADPELYAAWRQHIQQGFENNQTMFGRVLDGFMIPYWHTIWMYRALFGIGIGTFVLAGILGLISALGKGNTSTALIASALFGGLGVGAFLVYFVNRPLQALEENLQFITWLGIIYNTYWTRLAYTTDLATVQQELKNATDDTIAQIKELMDKHAELSGKR